jgi:hypothetical protein
MHHSESEAGNVTLKIEMLVLHTGHCCNGMENLRCCYMVWIRKALGTRSQRLGTDLAMPKIDSLITTR